MKKQKANVIVKTKTNKALIFLIAILAITIIALSILLVVAFSTANRYENSLEATYQKSYYDLVDNINNAEIKLSKVITANDEKYMADLLAEIARNANDAQINLSVLPVSINGIEESITFINQLGGYCQTLNKKILSGKNVSPNELETLQELYNCVIKMKGALNNMTQTMADGYSIVNGSLSIKNDYNDFTVQLQSIQTNDVEYPTMIYDGPFSDSQIRKTVKAFANSTNIVSENQAKQVVANLFDINLKDIKTVGETTSNFETYDFSFKNKFGSEMYAQISKQEGRLITLAGYKQQNQDKKLNLFEAEEKAVEFINKTGINNVTRVWYDIIDNHAYFNFAPIQNEIILYPDLVKVKVDLTQGEILGFEAKSYYINHVERNLPNFEITQEQAFSKMKEGYIVERVSKVLAPINYTEVLCYEFTCLYGNDVYYIYVNGITGQVDNILKVIQTSDGSLIM